jgi:hypothetical protein
MHQRRSSLDDALVEGGVWLSRGEPTLFPLLMRVPEVFGVEQANTFEVLL